MTNTPLPKRRTLHNNSGLPPAHSASPRSPWAWVPFVLSGVLGIAMFTGIVGSILYDSLATKMEAQTIDTTQFVVAQDDEEIDDTPPDTFHGRSVDVLLMGIDARTGQDSSIINPGDVDQTMRSDTTLIMHIAEDRESVTFVSLPRDMWVEIPECRTQDGQITPTQWGQFNWAFSTGAITDDLAAGVACTQTTVKSLTGYRPDSFAVIDFTGFSRMVEALGGVEVCLDEEIKDSQYTSLQLEAGCQVLDPITATQYARVRYVGDGSDMSRIQRQQDLLGAMAMDALDSNLLTDLPSLYAFLTTSIEATKVSPSLASLRADAGLASSLRDIEPENIRFVTMPVLTADFNANRLLPEEPKAQQLWEALFNDEPLPVGTVFMDIEGEYYEVLEDGELGPGEKPNSDRIGTLAEYQAWKANQQAK